MVRACCLLCKQTSGGSDPSADEPDPNLDRVSFPHVWVRGEVLLEGRRQAVVWTEPTYRHHLTPLL